MDKHEKLADGRWVPIEEMRPGVADRARLMGWAGRLDGDGWGSWGSSEATARESATRLHAEYRKHLLAERPDQCASS